MAPNWFRSDRSRRVPLASLNLRSESNRPGTRFGRAASLGDRRLRLSTNLFCSDRTRRVPIASLNLRSESKQSLVNGSVGLRRSEIDGYVYVAISLREMNPDFVAPNWFRWDRN